ncbi:TauD/TfdA family dioxygenase [Streptomyces sp. NBC_01020]|uniref:TauD/TfdA family dioxygenase n=1 Tax=unclassified Streptomyces TaxID=2593676 RepID=UPI002E216625|nr:TauD/TfdA family dioxygenase [Streptomyces sp. NBC_01020]WSX69887.1 TauD/TfdA family dioxygenase [Streptomyces sp. NBC_00932]
MTGVSSVLRRPLSGPAAWNGPDLHNTSQWGLRLSVPQLREIDEALRAARARGTPLLKLRAADFPLPSLAGELAAINDVLEHGRGFALISGLPVAQYGEAAASTVLWGLGQHLGIPVSQNAAGQMLGHVRDTGRTLADPATRGYQTRGRLPFHTDTADVLALLCLRPARSGAQLSLVSSAAVHNRVLARRPDLVERLYRRYCFDRREEQSAGELPYYRAPLASWHQGRLSLRYHRCYLESAQRFPDVPRLTRADRELFDLLDELTAAQDLRLDLDLRAGDLLLVNNHAALHARTEFEDGDVPEEQRHLLRLWLTPWQKRDLPADFWGDPHDACDRRGRGGVAPRDVIARAKGISA